MRPVVVACLTLATLTSGCGGMGSSEDDNAALAARSLYESLASNPGAACDELAQGTRAELEDSYGPCIHSLPSQHLPAAQVVVHVDVYGKDANVELDKDVVFLARFDTGWRVTAAGCIPKVDRPYDCTVNGP